MAKVYLFILHMGQMTILGPLPYDYETCMLRKHIIESELIIHGIVPKVNCVELIDETQV